MSPKTSYDDVPYLSATTPECDPMRLATIANLYGLPAVDPSDCDVLEIGCGDAGNLLSLSTAYPGIRAVGIDPAADAIERAEARRLAAGLDNLTLLTDEADRNLDASADYVLVHGVLSWVHEEPRKQVMELAGRAARPGAIVVFSYRVFPYAHYQLAAREMACEALDVAHERGEELTLEEQQRIAVERIRLAATTSGAKSVHGQLMALEADKMEQHPAWLLFHDDLSDPMQPFRMRDVAKAAAEQGLQYVGEAMPGDLWEMRVTDAFHDRIRTLAGTSAVRRQQLADDLVAAGFHSSVFVRSDEVPPAEPSAEGVPLYVRRFINGTPDGDRRSDEISAPVSQVIREHHPNAVTAEAIAEELGRDLADVQGAVMKLYSYGLARVTTSPPPVPTEVGTHPRTSPLIREELRDLWPTDGGAITSRFHLSMFYPHAAFRLLLRMLDGTRDLDAIRRDLPVAAGELGVEGVDDVLANLDTILAGAAVDGFLMPAED